MRKQFDISMRQQIESGEYKVQEKNSGRSARIICWDAATNTKYPIIALIEDYGIPKRYTVEGHCYMHNDDDLIIVTPEPKLTEFEEVVLCCIKDYYPETMSNEEMYDAAKEEAAVLLELARKELQPKYNATKVDEGLINNMVTLWKNRFKENGGCVTTIEEDAYRMALTDMYKQFAEELDTAFKHKDEVIYNRGYDKGHSDALKDVPTFKKTMVSCPTPYIQEGVLYYKGHAISVDELLDKLPKENNYGNN